MLDTRALAEKPVRRIVGLMSGTSVDGVDAALVEVSGTGPSLRLERIVATITEPFTDDERARIHSLFDGHVSDICEMNVILGERFAAAALAVIAAAGLESGDVDLIGSHGQTVYHIPPSAAGRTASSLQIGESAVIAEGTGIATVANFRPRDIAAGGHGAPLVPYVDWALCRREDETIALQNIGGIANVTVVTPDLDGALAFDTGPGNMVIDAAVDIATNRERAYDEGGTIASTRVPDERHLQTLLADPYFAIAPPKSTGREYWGAEFMDGVRGAADAEQLVSDLTEFVARSIHDAYARYVLPRHDLAGVYLSGGGERNPVLRRRLSELFAPIAVRSSDDLGLPGDSKEAVAFAVLANETICGTASNVPSATGASGSRVLGTITPGVS